MGSTYPIPRELSNKLYRQNFAKYKKDRYNICQTGRTMLYIHSSYDIIATMTAVEKFTIIELTINGKHYHGLTSKADCDVDNGLTGIAIAYNRAYKKMCGVV